MIAAIGAFLSPHSSYGKATGKCNDRALRTYLPFRRQTSRELEAYVILHDHMVRKICILYRIATETLNSK